MIIHKEKIAFIGMGKFGTAIAYRLDITSRYKIAMYSRNKDDVEYFNEHKVSPKCFHECKFETASATDDIADAVDKAGIIFISVSSNGIKDVCEKMEGLIKKNAKVIICSKGISENYPFFYSEIAKNILGKKANIYVFSGPNFADEIARGELSITTLAGKNLIKTKLLSIIFRSTNIKIESSNDIIGVQLFGAMKNVMAITVGILEGLGFGKNRIIRTLMHFVSEIQRLSKVYKAKKNSAYLAAGIGDIMLTCFDEKSRNKKFGIAIGRGEKIAELLEKDLVEGYFATKAIRSMSLRVKRFNKQSLKYINALYDILYKDSKPAEILNSVEEKSE
ncbi:NAD(P)H-dependent glycerol-3-phosphate dehydrogenase [Candidatus Deianiraea vastatrix]|uniref:Glycerol-3-phosphate dehydrogenase n=1 Tax=Candidatus Deianiraea vastatrix TaxID=2163644 RepID=A0A5B8XG29_9RICK|nr:NAD(P)H-dependent glycerol-3-phosphate dehydrogenase [Candidatus Deianiraea vastatrix]QED23856.1 Glycerol-3-phosphate dehydrogenase [NAD(P)+] [Candidatus Deianiraea vastatrix]